MNPDYWRRWKGVMEVITLRDPPVGGRAGPHLADKTKDKIHREELKWNLSFVKHYLHGHVICVVKWACWMVISNLTLKIARVMFFCTVLPQPSARLYTYNKDNPWDRRITRLDKGLNDWFTNIYLTYFSLSVARFRSIRHGTTAWMINSKCHTKQKPIALNVCVGRLCTIQQWIFLLKQCPSLPFSLVVIETHGWSSNMWAPGILCLPSQANWYLKDVTGWQLNPFDTSNGWLN